MSVSDGDETTAALSPPRSAVENRLSRQHQTHCDSIKQNSVPKVFTASPIDVVVLECRKICPMGWETGEIVRYLPDQKISAASQTVARTARIAPKGQAPIMCSQCSRFHPNLFIFAERVNNVFCPVEYFRDSPEAMLRFGRITRWLYRVE